MRKNGTDTLIRCEKRELEGDLYLYRLTAAKTGYDANLYSVEIEFSGADGTSTHGSVRDAFADPGRAILFFEKLVRGLATPIDLPYVLEDSMK